MSLNTLKEIRDNIASTTRETQVSSLIDNFINLAGIEIHNYANWTWLRRKQTFATVAAQEDYNLDSEVDRIVFLRDRTNNRKLTYLPDHLFYRFISNPEDTGSGISDFYRLWEETGFSTNLAAADTIYVVSDSTADTSAFTVRVIGRNSSGEPVGETLTLNGTTNVPSTTTFAAAGLLSVSKSAATTGTISVYRTTGATLLSELEPDNLNPRFKRISLYPIPSSAITLYLEYLERYRYLTTATDVPQMDAKWTWVLREGALAKMWGYKQNEVAMTLSQRRFEDGLKLMRAQDENNLDYVPVIQPRIWNYSTVRRTNDSVNDNFPSYSLVP